MALKELIATPGEAAAARVAELFQFAGNAREAMFKAVQLEVDLAIETERQRCAKIVRSHQIAFASDACGWALDKIKDGSRAAAIR